MKTAKVLQYNKRLIIGEASLNANSWTYKWFEWNQLLLLFIQSIDYGLWYLKDFYYCIFLCDQFMSVVHTQFGTYAS